MADALTNELSCSICLQQPLYEPTGPIRQHYTTTTFQKSSYTSYSTHPGGLPPPPVAAVNHPGGTLPQPVNHSQFPPPLTPPPPVNKPMSTLSSNLSELDMLLQDLSSAQFMAEVDRRNQGNLPSNRFIYM